MRRSGRPNASTNVVAVKRAAYLFDLSVSMPVNVSGTSRCHVPLSRCSIFTGRLTFRWRLEPGSHTPTVRPFTDATSLLLKVRCSMFPPSASLVPIASSVYAGPSREPRNLRPVARSVNVASPPRIARPMPCGGVEVDQDAHPLLDSPALCRRVQFAHVPAAPRGLDGRDVIFGGRFGVLAGCMPHHIPHVHVVRGDLDVRVFQHA